MIEIRRLRAEDIDAVYRIECACFTDAYAKETFERELTNKISYYITARIDDEIAGYAGIWRIADEAEVISIAVAPEFQRRGVGFAMLGHLVTECERQGVQVIRLEVRQSNLAAQWLYQKFKFEPYGIRKKYYENAEDAILMIRKARESDEDSGD